MTDRNKKLQFERGLLWAGIFLIVITLLSGCKFQTKDPTGSIPPNMSLQMTFQVVKSYPHDPTAFIQGLIYQGGYFYESTGLYGQSSLRKVALETGEVLQQIDLPPETFGEGLTLWEEQLLQLTWREGRGFIYAQDDFMLFGEFTYRTEGWGLTHDGTHLIMSDGSHRLYFLDPEGFQVLKVVEVFYQEQPLARLNELEYINGEVFANIWQTDQIVRIDPETGAVLGWINLAGILPKELITPTTDVLNGIAYDPKDNRLFITGKNWPLVFEILLIPDSEIE
jgi:glutamine cyclotransferase